MARASLSPRMSLAARFPTTRDGFSRRDTMIRRISGK
jgi:hypothetical protein